jgi:putative transposase
MQMSNKEAQPTGWHHAPVHKLHGRGAYMVTCGTLHKVGILTTPERLTEFQNLLFSYANKFGWQLQAWAVMSNHYHWIGLSPENEPDARSLKMLVAQLHEVSTKRINLSDGVSGRRIWCNYWESHITFQTSYFARLKYVHDNPSHHGVALNSAIYTWCSRAWLERTAKQAFVRQLDGFKIDTLDLPDDF